MVEGLQDPNSSQGRIDALAAYQELGTALQDTITTLNTQAGIGEA